MRELILIIHNLRSAHNVGSLLRSAEGLGVERVYITGYSPYPVSPGDERLPHVRQRVAAQINKTALGAAELVKWQHVQDIYSCLDKLEAENFTVAALEQTPRAIELAKYKPAQKIALVIGNEVNGIEPVILDKIDVHLEIRMLGRKESFNAAVAGAMALYHLRYLDK